MAGGAGLDGALSGCQAVVHACNVTTASRRTSVGFFTRGTLHVIEAGRRAGVAHHAALSVVGVDRVGLGSYAGK